MAIIVKIQGGLGNQLFQYAFGQALSYQIKQPVYFDLDAFQNSNRKLGLDQFNTSLIEAPKQNINSFFTLKNRIINKYLHETILNKKLIHFEKAKQFYEVPRNLNGSAYYLGYWQSRRYFSRINPILRKQLMLKKALSETNLLSTIKENVSVAIHVRRGDYTELNNQNVHGLIGKSYYDNAIKIIADKIPSALFIIFTDDLNWVKSKFHFNCKHIFAETFGFYTDVETMILMSLCKHQIIANSTYSWWAAWLNNNLEKQIIAPKKWFADFKHNYSLIPEAWITIE